MITVSENITNMMNKSARRIDARVELYNCSSLQGDGYNRELLNTFCGNGELIDFKVERTADDGKFFGFGVCQKLTVNLRDTNRSINIHKGQVLEVSFGVEGHYTYPCALFQVEEVNRDENTNNLTITAYDFLYKANEHRVESLALTDYTIRSFIAACAAKLNLPLKIEVEDPIFDLAFPTGANFDGSETIREALNAVAEATQTIFFVDWDWRLTFRRMKRDAEPVLHIDRSKYFELSNKSDRTLTAICHATELGDNVEIATGEPGVVQYVRNNPFWDLQDDIHTLLTNAMDVVGGMTISQFDCSWRGNFALEIGDKISMETKNGDTLIGYVINDTITYNGGLKEQTEWTFTEHNAETASNPVNLGEALKQTFARVNKAEGIIELVAKETQELADGIEDRISSITLTTDSIVSDVQRIEKNLDDKITTFQSTIDQTAESITSTVKRVEDFEGEVAELSSQIQQTAENIELKVSKDDIISAINLSSEGIDISADKINLTGYVEFSDLSTAGSTTINGSNITTGTINADRINMTGAIKWNDLTPSCQTTIASFAGEDGESVELPSYIKSTYIDGAELRSPKITGNDIKVYNTFQTIGYDGVNQITTGYMGAAQGMDASGSTTFGVALSNSWSSNTYNVGTNYLIITNAGIRLQSGSNRIILTPNSIHINADSGKAYYNGVEIGSGSSSGTTTIVPVWG